MTPTQAAQKLIDAHDAKTAQLNADLNALRSELATMRKNAKGRDTIERRATMAETALAVHVGKRSQLESILQNADELATIGDAIKTLCERRRTIAGSELLQTLFANALSGSYVGTI
jgi:hypothetical protein